MPDTKTAVPIGRTPFLGENPRPAKMFLDTGIEQVAGHVSPEGHWGWDGACLESVSAIAHDPLGYKAGDFNLYRYCGNEPLNRVDPNGTWYWVNGAGEYCGPYVKLYTGWWCVKPNVWEAAMDAAGGVVNCWWDCEVTIHKSVCAYAADAAGAATTLTFTHLEYATGVSKPLAGASQLTTLQSRLALLLAQNGYKGAAQQLLRSSAQAVSRAPIGTGITSGIAGVSIVEAGFSIYCGYKCSR